MRDKSERGSTGEPLPFYALGGNMKKGNDVIIQQLHIMSSGKREVT